MSMIPNYWEQPRERDKHNNPMPRMVRISPAHVGNDPIATANAVAMLISDPTKRLEAQLTLWEGQVRAALEARKSAKQEIADRIEAQNERSTAEVEKAETALIPLKQAQKNLRRKLAVSAAGQGILWTEKDGFELSDEDRYGLACQIAQDKGLRTPSRDDSLPKPIPFWYRWIPGAAGGVLMARLCGWVDSISVDQIEPLMLASAAGLAVYSLGIVVAEEVGAFLGRRYERWFGLTDRSTLVIRSIVTLGLLTLAVLVPVVQGTLDSYGLLHASAERSTTDATDIPTWAMGVIGCWLVLPGWAAYFVRSFRFGADEESRGILQGHVHQKIVEQRQGMAEAYGDHQEYLCNEAEIKILESTKATHEAKIRYEENKEERDRLEDIGSEVHGPSDQLIALMKGTAPPPVSQPRLTWWQRLVQFFRRPRTA